MTAVCRSPVRIQHETSIKQERKISAAGNLDSTSSKDSFFMINLPIQPATKTPPAI
jgi:hypothetical protein